MSKWPGTTRIGLASMMVMLTTTLTALSAPQGGRTADQMDVAASESEPAFIGGWRPAVKTGSSAVVMSSPQTAPQLLPAAELTDVSVARELPFLPASEVRVRLPADDWHNDSSSSHLPPPPGWVAAEFASLGRTAGSSPESEPLQPGDELTMETGRLASHKTGFFQKAAFHTAWIGRGGQQNMGLLETEMFLTVALPLPTRDYPMLVTAGADVFFIDGPGQPTLPSRLYDAYLDFMWLPKLTDRWLGVLSLSPGLYSDFDPLQSDAFRIKGKALLRFDWIPDELQVLFGILYLNRNDVNWLPAGGVIWDPDEDVHLEFVFPRPRFGYRFTATGLFEDWAYLAGEFGGETWAVQRETDVSDMLTYVDWRIFVGVERRRPGGAAARAECGYVFNRRLQFDSPTPDATPDATFMIRAGLEF